MYVCICNGITEKQIRSAVAGGANSLQLLRDELGVASQCGSCTDHALSLLEDAPAQAPMPSSLFYSAASPA
ncbi:bacterioferritin-associated ferredoxin [Congregibacter sp.]|uniref:bacterioferritin-associated ferredoxin n=1 Tax=Congregibacter sp. TaxID=2744308 RepID=UPI003F6D6B4A